MKSYLIIIFLCCNYNFMYADVVWNLVENPNLLSLQIENTEIPRACTVILDGFAECAANFTKCSIMHARPISLCSECINEYVDFHNKYEELLTKVANGTSCKSWFISHDRLDAVLDYHDSILAVWEKGHCNACFDWIKGMPQMSNNTIQFKNFLNDTRHCMNITNINGLDANGTDAICEKCMTYYIKLDEFYKSLSEDGIGVDSVCMDIVDSMNATRYIWSKVLSCCSLRRTPEIIFLCCTAIIATLPLLFYVVVRFCGPIRDLPNVLKQSRFKQMILRSSDGVIN